jgi:hypothetical protein
MEDPYNLLSVACSAPILASGTSTMASTYSKNRRVAFLAMGIKPRAWIEWFRASTASRLKAMTAPNVEPEPILFMIG